MRNELGLVRRAGLLGALVLVVVAAGCAGPPSRLELKYFNVRTNLPSGLEDTNGNLGTGPADYSFEPNAAAQDVANTVGWVTGMFGPWGEMATVVSGWLFGLYATVRSSKSSKVAGVLAQVIETGRQVLASTPQGAALGEQWKQWMVMHQAEAGVLSEVSKLLDSAVDPASAKYVAGQLVDRMSQKEG
jgi:hypothetical protein